MKTGTLEIKSIFSSDRRLLVPLFQRPYVWKRETQWEPLWDDLRNLADRTLQGLDPRPHFLGAIVLDQVKKPLGTLETRYIIDGQQRLTTLQLLLEAFADFCGEAGQSNHHKALLKLTRNDDPMSTDPDEVFKVWPTNSDREAFRRVMNCGSPAELRASYGVEPATDTVGHPIADGYLYFHGVMADWLDRECPGFEARLDALLVVVRSRVRLVCIDLEDEDDAQLIFETLNARGTPLLPSDLVKNWLFHRAELANLPLEPLYASHLEGFDNDAAYWRKETGIGHNVRARIDFFLQHFLTIKKGDEIPLAHLYKAYCDHASKPENGDPRHHFAELATYAEVFKGFDHFDTTSREAQFFYRLGAMNTIAAHPLVMELFRRHGKDKKLVREVLIDLESLLVRRMICQLNTRGYNRLFIDLLATLDGPAEDLRGRVRTALAADTADSNRWPRDTEFRLAWRTNPIFQRLVQRRVRIVLEALDLQLHTEKTEVLHLGETLTIEHLLPQAWKTHWPMGEGGDTVEARNARDDVLHTIGNLTLVRTKLNSSLSNGPWKNKRKEILKHSALNLNRPLVDWDEWDEAAIRWRSDELFKAARKIWPAPAE